jgi:5-methyltetrahydropteroyltriglutamate--homocysteine methyltransferase
LIRATRDYEMKAISENELKKKFEEDSKKLVELQTYNGIDCISDGLLDWQDIFRPFTIGLPALSAGALKRWFNGHTYFRQPIVSDKLESEGDILGKWIRTGILNDARRPWKLTLPGPYTFSLMCENRFYGRWDEVVYDFADMLAKELKGIAIHNPGCVDLCEPSLVYIPPGKEHLEVVRSAVGNIGRAVETTMCLRTYFGDLSSIYPAILDFDVDCIGVDFFETPIELLDKYAFTKKLACGCVDGRNSLVERVSDIATFCGQVIKKVGNGKIVICPNCDLEYLPRAVAEDKVGVLGGAAKVFDDRGD